MPYILSNFTAYRSDTILKDCGEILKEDCEWVCRSLDDRGLLFLIAFIVLMGMSLLKAIVYIFEELRKPKMKRKMTEEEIEKLLNE